MIKKIKNIFRIDLKNQYEKKMSTLINEKHIIANNYILNDKNLRKSALLYAQKNKLIISIELIESGFDDAIGFVDLVENDLYKIIQIDEYGNNDGETFINLSDISQISLDSEDETIIMRLWKFNNI